MKKTAKSILVAITVIVILFATTAFIVNDPQADFSKRRISLSDQISLSEIPTKNQEISAFKSSVKIRKKNFKNPTKEFYGQEIVIADNPQVDKILIGVTNNLISRVEVWNKNKLIEIKELDGACDQEFHGETFDEIAEQSKKHGMEMFQQQDEAHMKAMNEMQAPNSMSEWMDNKRREFDALPDND